MLLLADSLAVVACWIRETSQASCFVSDNPAVFSTCLVLLYDSGQTARFPAD
jgi:hypothetical protein